MLYAREASLSAGQWLFPFDSSAAGGSRAWNPDAGTPKITSPAASPANYFDVMFEASAGVGVRVHRLVRPVRLE